MPTIKQLQESYASQMEFPETRRTDDPMYVPPKQTYLREAPKPKPNPKIIFINAICDKFTIQEMVEEKKAPARLRQIKILFESYSQKLPFYIRPLRGAKPRMLHGAGTLRVTTGVVNPELPFINLYV